jgi:hypothetical protein
MKLRILAPVLVLAAAGAAAQTNETPEAKPAPKPTPAPFYEKYLIHGNALDDQISEQEKRIQASPDDANLRTDFGNLLAMRRFPDQAAEQYEMAAKLDKTNFVALYNLGLLYETQGKYHSAISAYKRSIARKAGFPPSRFHLGLLYEKQNDLDAAVAEYALALQIDPNMRDPRRNPLVVQTELMYQASLANYPHDRAVASMKTDAVFFEEGKFRHVPVDRALASQEVATGDEDAEPPPREVGPGNAAGTAEGTTPPARRGNRVFPAPPPAEGVGPGTRPRSTSTGPARTPRATRPQPQAPQVAPTPAPAPPPEEQPEVAPEQPQEPPPSSEEPS